MQFLALVSACFLTVMVNGQESCVDVLTGSDCYFNGAAVVPPDSSSANKYFAIGGLFNVHEKGSSAYACGTEASVSGIANMQAFLWAIDYYQKQYLNSRDMSVGAVVFDNCMRTDQTIENLLGFSQCKLQVQGLARDNVVAFVGPYGNKDAMRTGMLASDLNLGLLSPSANAMDLNEENQKTLLQFRPSIKNDLEAIVAFLGVVQSKYAMIFYSDDPFWMAAYKELEMLLKANNICPTFTKSVSDTSNFDTVVTELDGLESAKYVIPLMGSDDVGSMMSAIKNSQVKGHDLVFILTSEVGNDEKLMTENNIVAQNAIVVNLAVPLEVKDDMVEFNKYLMNSNATIYASAGHSNFKSPWLQDVIANVPMLKPGSNDYLTVSRTIMSVKAIVKGINTLISNDCGTGNYQFCDALRKPDSYDKRFDAIRASLNVFENDMNTLKPSQMQYTYYRVNNENVVSSAEFTSIGTFVATNKVAEITVDLFNIGDYGLAYSVPQCPTSLTCCAAPVQPSTTPESTLPTTPLSTKNPMTDKSMVFYPKNQAITGAYSDKYRTDEEFGTRFDLGQKWIIALSVLAGLGILLVLIFEIYILYKLLGTHMGNKWRTMWLGQLLLLGIFLCYLVLFAYIFIPTKATCGITRFGVGVSYAICFAVLLVKLMVILTSKSTDVLLAGDMESPNYLKGVYQVLMFLFAVGVQVVIDVQWLITVPPEAVQVKTRSGAMVWICNHYTWEAGRNMNEVEGFVRTNFENHMLSLTYIMLLILITTILSLNAHGIITNHRESVFIGIAAGFSIPIWLAWGLVGGLNMDNDNAHEYGDACIAFGLLLTATLIMFTMFLPKVRQLVNLGVEGIYLEDDRDTYYAGSVINAPPSYKSKGQNSVIYVNNQGIYSEPVVIGNGDQAATHLKHVGSTYSAPPTYLKKTDSTYGGSRVLKVTDDLKGRHPQKRPQSEVAYVSSGRPRSMKGTLPRSRSHTDLGAL